MVTENEIKKYAAEHMHYTGKITPYIKSKVLAEMNDSGDSDISDNDIEVKKSEKVKKPKSKSKKSKASKIISRIGSGFQKTANYLGECGERYNIEQQTKTVKSKPKKKPVAKSKVKPKTTKRKTTAKTVKRVTTRSAKSTQKTQKDFEKEIMRCM